MYRKVKLVDKFINQRKINKAEIIDSSQKLKGLYDSLVKNVDTKKMEK
jgi:hypothetical protein